MSRGKILAVDDSDTELMVLTGLLRRHGYTVITANNATEAVAALERETPDVVLLDVVMPGVNGYQLCRTLRRDPRFARLPIIMVTSRNQRSDREWGLKQGASEYLTKPVQDQDLLAVVGSWL